MRGVLPFPALLFLFGCVNGENLAFMKPTWQSNTLLNYSSDKAVDGLYEIPGTPGDSCAVSGGEMTLVKWTLDLGSIQSIHTITIIYRTNGLHWKRSPYTKRFLGFSVFVQNKTNEDEKIQFFRDTKYTIATIPKIWSYTNPVPGRYVVYQNSRIGGNHETSEYSTWAYLDLCEVIVYGCPLGFYGPFCSQPCPFNCRHCDLNSGTCLGGCIKGFAGNQCQENTRYNLALYRPTNATNPYNNEVGGWLVVDGKKNDLSFQGRACLVTQNGKRYAEWRVDLQLIRSIERVRVYFRTDNIAWDKKHPFTYRALGFSLIVSNTTDPQYGVVCFRENKHNGSTIPAVFDAECNAVGQYVFYTSERLPRSDMKYPSYYSDFAFADICEVEVYGCPIGLFNGADCSIPCLSICTEHYLENLALKEPVWLSNAGGSYTYEQGLNASHPFHYLTEYCTVTPDRRHVEWYVDLEAIRDVEYVEIHFRKENERLADRQFPGEPFLFWLFISNTTSKDEGKPCWGNTQDDIPEILNMTCPLRGRYIIFDSKLRDGSTYPLDHYNYERAKFCKVKVYGCPVPVSNHPDCSRPCPENCEECFTGTGVCKKCHGAYEGDRCQHEKSMYTKSCDVEF